MTLRTDLGDQGKQSLKEMEKRTRKMVRKSLNYLRGNILLQIMLLYGIFYQIAFFWLERRNVRVHLITSELDEEIPFCEYFIIPYFLWFIYIAITAVYFICVNKDYEESKRYVLSFCAGMTVFLLVSLIYPNGQNLRPQLGPGGSVFIEAVRLLYRIDTPTNILPSMHVYVTVANSIALCRQEPIRRRKCLVAGIWVLSISIILSTLFLKQHCVLDVVSALGLSAVCFRLVYRRERLYVYGRDKRRLESA